MCLLRDRLLPLPSKENQCSDNSHNMDIPLSRQDDTEEHASDTANKDIRAIH